MSGKKKNGKGSFLREFSFVLAVLLLIGALGGIYFYNRMKNVQEEAKLEQIIANEKSPQISGAKVLSEQIAMTSEETSEFEAENESEELKVAAEEKEVKAEAQEKIEEKPVEKSEEKPEEKPEEKTTEKPTEAEAVEEPKTEAEEKLVKKEEEVVPEEPQTKAQEEATTVATTEKPSEITSTKVEWQAAMPVGGAQGEPLTLAQEKASEQTTETALEVTTEEPVDASLDIKNSSILIINGTYKNGVAAYWEGKLREAGYTNLLKASYSGKADQLTAIYGVDKAKAEAFKEFFPTAEIRDGAVPGGFTMSDDSGTTQPPTTCDFYIVVGIADAINS